MHRRRVLIVDHARERMEERGVTEDEVSVVLTEGSISEAEKGRMSAEKVFDFSSHWQNRYYRQKKIQVIYVEEDAATVVITVYASYGAWD